MKLENVKHIIDKYFDEIDPLEMVKDLEKLGYEFEVIPDDDFIFSTRVDSVSTFVAEYLEIKGNHLFEKTFYGGDKVNYKEKTHISPPICNFGNDIEGNYTYAMAA